MKIFYPRSHKGQHVKSISKQYRRARILQRLKTRINLKRKFDARDGAEEHTKENQESASLAHAVPFDIEEKMPPSSPEEHYQMSSSTKIKVDMDKWIKSNPDDPALSVS